VEVVGQTIDEVIGAAQEPVDVRDEIVDAGELGGVSNKPPLSLRREGQ